LYGSVWGALRNERPYRDRRKRLATTMLRELSVLPAEFL
jgi:hypothetical protein